MLRPATPTEEETRKQPGKSRIQVDVTKKRRNSRHESDSRNVHAKSARHRKKLLNLENSIRAHSVAVINESDGKNKWKEHARNNVDKVLAKLEMESKDKWSDYVAKELSKHSDSLLKRMEKKIEPVIKEKHGRNQIERYLKQDEDTNISIISMKDSKPAAVNLCAPTEDTNVRKTNFQQKREEKPKNNDHNAESDTNKTRETTNEDVNKKFFSEYNNGDKGEINMAGVNENDNTTIADDVDFILTVDNVNRKTEMKNNEKTKPMEVNKTTNNDKHFSEEDCLHELEESILKSHEHNVKSSKNDKSQEVDMLIKDLQIEI